MADIDGLLTYGENYPYSGGHSDVLRTAENYPNPGITRVAYPGVVMAFSGKEVGNVDYRFIEKAPEDGDDPGDIGSVIANRSKMLSTLPYLRRYVVQKALGAGNFIDLSDTQTEELKPVYETDGLFTNKPGVALALNPADCGQMVIFDRQATALGVIHTGRHGVEEGIHLTALEHIQSRYDVAREDVRIYFGPSIREASYCYPELPNDQLDDPKWDGFMDFRDGNYHVDVLGRTIAELESAGIDASSQIAVSPIDVGADRRYFSHVRSKKTGEAIGRNALVALLIA